ncbi:hypothetical protein KR009_000285 [Drosophila setifemur]|nr:hypothetical protein KR009_000285 [Drosophila setifemur]
MALNNRMNSAQLDAVVDYKFACRCCLKADAEYLKLDSHAVARSLDPADAADEIPLLRCLLYCIRSENAPELPQYICVECSQSLQIAYYFLQNAVRAHEILCRKLCPGRASRSSQGQRFNGSIGQEQAEMDFDRTNRLKTIKHECQVCGVVVYNRLELKQHIRLHAEGLTHSCKMCSFSTLKQRQLLDHYRSTHNLSNSQAEEHMKANNQSPVKEEEVKVCTLEDMELLIPTVLTPEDLVQPSIDADQLRDIEHQLAVTMGDAVPGVDTLTSTLPPLDTQSVSIGTEFLVLPDGSLQQVNGGGVVIEYIDDSKPAQPNPQPHNINMSLHNLLGGSDENEAMDIDVNELIVEDVVPQIKDLPKFFCDQCDYYSLRSADLIQHYKTRHHRADENGRKVDPTSTGEETRVYSCDMCLFETPTASQLRAHYTERHMVQPTEVQLRPSWSGECRKVSSDARISEQSSNEQQTATPSDPANNIPMGIKYPTVAADQQPTVATTLATITQASDINVVVDTTPLFYAAASNSVAVQEVPEATVDEVPGEANGNSFTIFPEMSEANLQANESAHQMSANTSNANISMFGDMQDFIDNTDVAAICTIPADDMPVVDGDDIVIDNNNISLDFDAENLFEDFEEDEEVVGEEEDDEEDADNEDENDNNEAATDQNLLLTSDDDDVDDFDDEQSKHLQKPYCIYCNKKFTSQYKFENHMFVHRGLAPYRCELCTNLYNMKRLLIRHYKTVHKRMPTRDMVQAKGDKVSVARTNLEKLHLDVNKNTMLMCAKCPFECESDAEMRKHLNAHHGINDGVSVHANEVFIIRKLPYECPRCIRSFAAKSTLTRHLQRSHLVDTIIEMQSQQHAASSAATTTTTTATATTTGPGNSASDEDRKQSEADLTAAAGNGGGNGECEEAGKDVGAKAERDMAINAESTVPKDEIDVVTLDTATTVTTATSTISAISSSSSSSTTSALSPITNTASSTSAPSTLFATPTPFDFEYDFMGVAAQRSTPTLTPTSSSNPSGLLNGSDKLLTTAALTPSSDNSPRCNSRLPRAPIYVCKLCNMTFDELGKLVKHEMELHSNTQPSRWGYQHKCAICNTSYRTLTLLKFHMKRHMNRKAQCKLCPKTFVANNELERHIKAKHGRQKTFRCALDGCLKTFAYKHHMVRHQNASHLKVRHVCTVCDKEMLTSQHLRNHMAVHKGTTSYKCPMCDRTYLRRGRIRGHVLKVHKTHLTEEQLADIYRDNVGNTSPHDLKVMTRKGQLVRRKDLDAELETNQEADAAEDISK